MHCEIVRNPNGSFRIKFSGGITELELLDELKYWAKANDVEVSDPSEDLVDYKSLVKTAASQTPKRKERGDTKGNPLVFPMWHKWYEVLNEKHKEIVKPQKFDNVEGRFIKTILEEYGEQLTLEIFKIAVYDWDALRTLHDKLPPAPTLRNVFYNRRELSIGVTNGGITTAKNRVSEYHQAKGGDTTSGWDLKKQE